MRIVTFGSDGGHPLTEVALQVVRELHFVEHLDHVTALDSRDDLRDPRSSGYRSHLADLEPDIFLSAAYALLLPEEVLAIPRLGSINVHPSLLPAYRGVRAIWWALYEGSNPVGVTIHEMTAQVDSGPILGQVSLLVEPGDEPADVSRRGAELVRPVLRDVLARICESDRVVGEPQPEGGSYRSTPAKEAHRLEIDWSQPAAELVRRDRIFHGYANIPVGRWRIYAERVDEADPTDAAPGRIVRIRPSRIDVAVGNGSSVRIQLAHPLRSWVKLLLIHVSGGQFGRGEPPTEADRTRSRIV